MKSEIWPIHLSSLDADEASGYFEHTDWNGDGAISKTEWRQGVVDGRQECFIFRYVFRRFPWMK